MNEKYKKFSFLKKFFYYLFSLNGLVVTLLIGISISLISSKIDEIVERQRYLELLELEIRLNQSEYKTILNSYQSDKVIYTDVFINDSVYKAGLEKGYVLTIDNSVLPKVVALYGTINTYNKILEDNYNRKRYFQEQFEQCIFSKLYHEQENKELCKKEQASYIEAQRFYSEEILKIWEGFAETSNDTANSFNPTKERLNSTLLNLLITDKPLEIQK